MLEAVLKDMAAERAFELQMRKFGEMVTADPKLKDQLKTANTRDAFVSTYVRLAAEKGIRFTDDQMRVAMQEQKQGRNWVLPHVVQIMIRDL